MSLIGECAICGGGVYVLLDEDTEALSSTYQPYIQCICGDKYVPTQSVIDALYDEQGSTCPNSYHGGE